MAAENAGALAWRHNDPFDRMLVAQARCLTLTLTTADVVIRAYPGVAQMWAA
jgi:PIN domain nuclease of toxin-antitoxin system